MVKVDFSQNELKLLLGLIQIANQTGKLQLGDMVMASEIVKKVDAQVVKEDKPANGQAEKKEEVTTVS